MPARIINLRQRRKQKQRDDKRAAADENAVQSGRTKSERNVSAKVARIAEKRLDGHRIDRDGNKGANDDDR